MVAEHLLEAGVYESAIADDQFPGDDGVPGRDRPAAKPRLDRV
jgi:hypothetical protein